ncbi:MAG: hypothetical protein WC436_05280 [Candidatus Babeliales bacterium]
MQILKKFFIYLFFINFNIFIHASILLQEPEKLSEQEIKNFEKENLKHGWGASWSRGNNNVTFIYNEGVVEIKQEQQVKSNKTETDEEPYCINERLILKNQKPKNLTLNELCNLVKTKTVTFYTGAGISAAAGIWTMQPLMDALGITKNDNCYQNIIKNENNNKKIFKEFCDKAFTSQATPAHNALKNIALYKKAQILTENFDLLQEHLGIKALHISGPWLRANVTIDDLKAIDCIICIALSYDDRGFLGWYKANNPTGIIVAIDLEQPSYLGNEDFLIQGDCQKLLPELEKKILE